ncbi:MAG: hypothetical protein ACYS7Y_25650 [Planctomycetota bacterium]
MDKVPIGINAKGYFKQYVFTSSDIQALGKCVNDDSWRYVYNGVLSFLGGLSSLKRNQCAWAVTKLYYTVFYIGRAALCRSGIVIFHAPLSAKRFTQFELLLNAGQQAKVVSSPPSTHKLVAKRFQEVGYPSFMSGLEIEGMDPILWLMNKREFWQYRSGRFPDPDFPDILENINISKVQRLLQEYLADRSGLFLSDIDHALVSIPFRLVCWALGEDSITDSEVIRDFDISHLRKQCHIGNQTLSTVARLLSETK